MQVNVTGGSVNEAVLSHPDYPSMLAISDCLKQWKVENIAIRAEKDKIEEIPLPFIAFMGREFKTVTQITGDEVYFLNDDNKIQKESKEKFLNSWNGVALVAEVEEGAGEKEYNTKKQKENIQSLTIPAIIGFALLWIIVSSFSFAASNLLSAFAYSALLLCKHTGIIVSGLLLWYEIDKYNPTLQKICTAGSGKTNCNAILSSSKAKIFSWLSWSEVGFFYFAGGFLVLNLYPQSANIVAWLNVASLPYIIFSLGYQKFIAKQWCPLCLAVQGLLFFEFVFGYTGGFLTMPATAFIQIGLIFLFPVIFWYFIKPHLLKEQENKTKKYELVRLKNNKEIFDALLSKQKQITHSTEGLGITLGNSNAANTLIKVCNPYCGPCAKAHPEIERLLEENKNLKVQIIFTATNKEGDSKALPVKHLLAIAEKNNEPVTKKALDDWYLSEEKNYELFAAKYPMNGEIKMQEIKVEAMDKWCRAADISFTPSIFINGHQLPELYNIRDLNYLL